MTKVRKEAEITEMLRDDLGEESETVQQDYYELYEWMITKGKNPRRAKALNETTASNYIRRLDHLHRLVIKYIDPDDRTTIQDDHADELLYAIDQGEITKQQGKNRGEEYGESAKRKFANTLQCYFRWRYYEGEMTYEWEPEINFSDGKGESAYRFTHRELGLLFDEAKTYGSLPSYYETSEAERDKINGLVAQRLGIPKEQVTRNDWLHADWSTHVYSLVTVGHDCGLAPVEIAAAKTHWYDPETKTLTIPTEYACKEREKETVALADDTAEGMSEWFQERRHLEKYDGSNNIWLNREGNPYTSGSLCNLLRKLCEEAGIKTEGRKIVWYSLRQTMGRNVTDEGELSEANDQLRHSRLETTQERYNQTPVEKLQARLNETRKKVEKAANDPEYNPYEDQAEASDTPLSQSGTPSETTTDAVTPTTGGNIHIDAMIPDTTQARVDITKQLLNDGTGD